VDSDRVDRGEVRDDRRELDTPTNSAACDVINPSAAASQNTSRSSRAAIPAVPETATDPGPSTPSSTQPTRPSQHLKRKRCDNHLIHPISDPQPPSHTRITAPQTWGGSCQMPTSRQVGGHCRSSEDESVAHKPSSIETLQRTTSEYRPSHQQPCDEGSSCRIDRDHRLMKVKPLMGQGEPPCILTPSR
jgi:hypothetical protein